MRIARPEAVLLFAGLLWLLLLAPNGGPFSGRFPEIESASDLDQHYVAALAAMYDPIDWSQPLAISTLRYPIGTSLLLTDAFPLLTLPLRILWQAGLQVDPPLALDLWVGLITLLAPLALYPLARRLGSSPPVAVVASISGVLLLPTVGWQLGGSQGLASWPLLALLLAELVALESGGSRRRWLAALLAGALWWAHPALGASAAGLVALHALRLPLRREWRSLLPLAGSLIGLIGLRAADIRVPEGFSYVGGAASFISSLPGLLTPLPDGPEALFLWGSASLLLFLVVQRQLWRQAPLVAVGALILALGSLGSSGYGRGVFPEMLLRSSPFTLFDATDRFYLVAALLGLLGAPAVIERLLASFGRRAATLTAISLSLIAGSTSLPALSQIAHERLLFFPIFGFVGESRVTVDPIWGAEREAWRSLVGSYQRVLFLPHVECEATRILHAKPSGGQQISMDMRASSLVVESATARREVSILQTQRNQMTSALLASEHSLPAYSFYAARELLSDDGAECAHLSEPPPPGTLLIASTDFELLEGYEAPWERLVEEMAYCSGPLEGRYLDAVRVCGDDPAPIGELEARLASIEGSP